MRVVQISGGIDSLALLWLLQEQWPELTLFWVDSGAAYSETRALIQRLAHELPVKGLVIAQGEQPLWIKQNGFPVDVLPVRRSLFGQTFTSIPGPIFAPWSECCNANIWEPAKRLLKHLGVQVVYRGQRRDDTWRAAFPSGYVHEGIRFEFPLHDWTRDQVWAYAERVCPDYIPAYYRQGERSSRDCWSCTAFLAENQARIANLPGEQRQIVRERLQALAEALDYERQLTADALR